MAGLLPPVVARRGRHVVTENARVARFVEASTRGDLSQLGMLMVESHTSLQNDYQVSCAELDFLVDTALAAEGVFGARMTGGGFGGCTVTALRLESVAGFQERISRAYEAKFGVTPQVYRCQPSDGAGELRDE